MRCWISLYVVGKTKEKCNTADLILNTAIETAAASGKPGLHDVRIINISLVSDINVIQEATEPPQSLSNLNISKVSIYVKEIYVKWRKSYLFPLSQYFDNPLVVSFQVKSTTFPVWTNVDTRQYLT